MPGTWQKLPAKTNLNPTAPVCWRASVRIWRTSITKCTVFCCRKQNDPRRRRGTLGLCTRAAVSDVGSSWVHNLKETTAKKGQPKDKDERFKPNSAIRVSQ